MTATDPHTGGDDQRTTTDGRQPADPRRRAEYDEHEPVREDPVVATTKTVATIQLRRWIIAGMGALIAASIIGILVVVLVHPELSDFGAKFAKLVVGGLITVGGLAVWRLFGRAE